ncbi:hypothetical protein GCM10023340_20730 [Nocardioides marinquilinus]|uniref:Uncharacterized protein n=1 Tax=Nocardioides marinquilinus TaxID=1210400 RepID=A0ABP9PJR2_9ACTN
MRPLLRGLAATFVLLLGVGLASLAVPGPAHARVEPAPAPTAAPDRLTPAQTAYRAGRAVNHDRRGIASRFTTPAAQRRMFDLRSQGFRWDRPERCRRRDGAWHCLTPMSTRTDPVPHQVAVLVVKRVGDRLRVVEVAGLD